MPVDAPHDVDDIEHWYGSSKRGTAPAVRRAKGATFRDPDETGERAGAAPAASDGAPPETLPETPPADPEPVRTTRRGDARRDVDWPFVAR